ncbi:hypothetical protein F4703DRAFT_1850910, partial [Phycomyces blakesleeanus]
MPSKPRIYLMYMLSVYSVSVAGQFNVSQPKTMPEGLPAINWDILQMDPATRENLCQRQTAYCAVSMLVDIHFYLFLLLFLLQKMLTHYL